MGGCASKPKESDILNVPLPAEDVIAPKKAEGGETVEHVHIYMHCDFDPVAQSWVSLLKN